MAFLLEDFLHFLLISSQLSFLSLFIVVIVVTVVIVVEADLCFAFVLRLNLNLQELNNKLSHRVVGHMLHKTIENSAVSLK